MKLNIMPCIRTPASGMTVDQRVVPPSKMHCSGTRTRAETLRYRLGMATSGARGSTREPYCLDQLDDYQTQHQPQPTSACPVRRYSILWRAL